MTFLLDPYAARNCPVKTFNAFDPGTPKPEKPLDESLLEGYIIICIDACKKLLRRIFAYSHHECLVSVITTTEISFSESMCHSYLWQFLSISKDTKFSLSRKNFSSSCKTTLAAENGYHIIFQDLST